MAIENVLMALALCIQASFVGMEVGREYRLRRRLTSSANANEVNHEATCPVCKDKLYLPHEGELGLWSCECGRMTLEVLAGRTPTIPDVIIVFDGDVKARGADGRIEIVQRHAAREAERRAAQAQGQESRRVLLPCGASAPTARRRLDAGTPYWCVWSTLVEHLACEARWSGIYG